LILIGFEVAVDRFVEDRGAVALLSGCETVKLRDLGRVDAEADGLTAHSLYYCIIRTMGSSPILLFQTAEQ
jgi:hypothetical protein